MVTLRCLYLIAFIFWVCGMVTLGGLVAPATFDVLEAHHGFGERLEEGDVFGEMLRRFRFFECRWATILLGCLGTLFARSPHPTAIGIRVVSVVAMLGVSLYSGFGITGQLAALQLEIKRDVTTLANGIQFAARFDHLYTLNTLLLLLNLVGGLSLI